MNRIRALTEEASESSLTPSTMWGHREKMAIYEPGSGPSPEPDLADTLLLDFQTLEPQENTVCCFKPLILWYFVMAALENEYTAYIHALMHLFNI